jgi:ribonuclease BN (tRNA processing enzyme)
VPEGISGPGRKLHAPPSIIAKIATQTDAKKLVLSHFMARSLRNLEENLKQVRPRYDRPEVDADDLDCIKV